MPSLLLINPNTSPNVTALLAHHAGAIAPPDGVCHAVTAPFGAPYIADAAACAVADQAVPAAWQAHVARHGEPDAVLVACFGDPGVAALRACTRKPVLGLAEVAMRAGLAQARQRGGAAARYAIVTGGAAWRPLLWALAERLDLAGPLAAVVTVERTGAELMADPAAARDLLLAACASALRHADVHAVVIGGAALADLAAPLACQVQVPLVDNVRVGLQAAWHAACEGGAIV